MQSTGVNGGDSGRVRAEDVISKLKDDGDFDRLRLKIIRKLKENFINIPQEELRSNIISMVKQSAALNRPGAENMKPRQLSDAIHQEIGDKLMSQVSDGVWDIIRSPDGMKTEIKETVQSVYEKLLNPRRADNGDSSSHMDSPSKRNRHENNDGATSAGKNNGALSDGELNGPPGFASAGSNKRNKNNRTNHLKKTGLPTPHNGQAIEAKRGGNVHLKDFSQHDNRNVGAPPGFSSAIKHKNSGDASDEDPDVPPGFG
ncbi:hypothetical protein CDL12_18917 [Handroanthus impetiginosus]|uniref:BOD1/SHG1 domain-containing protein n=1 Tax=Handroanthus impetiginosus TaxID=429701 RepID=A0A2G9GT87_9LAMI|nr:hypothetical protein CDL12_18917 [Handroanthus impetiginosus]